MWPGDMTDVVQVCRHHAAAVCDEAHGNTKQFQCPYHGWVYGESSSIEHTQPFRRVLRSSSSVWVTPQ